MPRRVSSPIFVGRVTERAALSEAIERAAAGSPGVVLITGEAGVGKTRLLAEAATLAAASGIRSARGVCVDVATGTLAYTPFVEIVREFHRDGFTKVLPDATRIELGRVVPEAATERPDASAGGQGGQGGQGRIFAAIRDLLATAAMSRPARVRLAVLVAALATIASIAVVGRVREPRWTSPYDPPVLAGQQLWGACAGGFYARLGETIVLTSTGHCTREGEVAYAPDGTTIRGVFGPAARDATCPYADHTCASSDINYLVVVEDQIPWGHLNLVDYGAGGVRVMATGTRPLACGDIAIGDAVEINGRNIFRSGTVAEKGDNLKPGDGAYFPCMIAARIPVATGDSGGAVLVRGIPAGVTSRSFGGLLGFTPLAEGLAQLGLELCTTPDCDLDRPSPPAGGATP